MAHELFRTQIHNGILGNLAIDKRCDPTTAPVTIFRMRVGAHNATGVSDYNGAAVESVVVPPPSAIAHSR